MPNFRSAFGTIIASLNWITSELFCFFFVLFISGLYIFMWSTLLSLSCRLFFKNLIMQANCLGHVLTVCRRALKLHSAAPIHYQRRVRSGPSARPDSMLFRQSRSEQVPWPKTLTLQLCVCAKWSVSVRLSVWPSERTWQTTGTTPERERCLLCSRRRAVRCASRWPRTPTTSPRSPSWLLRWWKPPPTARFSPCASLVLPSRPWPDSRAGTLSLSCARGQSP